MQLGLSDRTMLQADHVNTAIRNILPNASKNWEQTCELAVAAVGLLHHACGGVYIDLARPIMMHVPSTILPAFKAKFANGVAAITPLSKKDVLESFVQPQVPEWLHNIGRPRQGVICA